MTSYHLKYLSHSTFSNHLFFSSQWILNFLCRFCTSMRPLRSVQLVAKPSLTVPIVLVVSLFTAHAPVTAAFDPPPDQGSPAGTAGGGSRSVGQNCLQDPQSLETFVALSPQNFVGLTASEQPSFWVYVPPTVAKSLEFSLFEDGQTGVYQANVAITQAGFVKLTLPATTKLEPRKSYYWTAALVCDTTHRTNDWVVGSWVKYQPIDQALQQALDRASLLQKVDLYANAGFWYEALHQLAEMKETQPNHPELAAHWSNLMQLAGLNLDPTRLSALP